MFLNQAVGHCVVKTIRLWSEPKPESGAVGNEMGVKNIRVILATHCYAAYK